MGKRPVEIENKQLVEVVAVMRGLLAEPYGDGDREMRNSAMLPVILSVLLMACGDSSSTTTPPPMPRHIYNHDNGLAEAVETVCPEFPEAAICPRIRKAPVVEKAEPIDDCSGYYAQAKKSARYLKWDTDVIEVSVDSSLSYTGIHGAEQKIARFAKKINERVGQEVIRYSGSIWQPYGLHLTLSNRCPDGAIACAQPERGEARFTDAVVQNDEVHFVYHEFLHLIGLVHKDKVGGRTVYADCSEGAYFSKDGGICYQGSSGFHSSRTLEGENLEIAVCIFKDKHGIR